MDKKNILITGGAGFIGSNLSLRIQKVFPNSNIVVFDCFRNENKFSNGNLMSFGHYDNLIDFNGEIICGNLNNIDDLNVLKKYNFDYIFHQAAISDTRVDNQEAIIKTNLNSFYFILDLAKKVLTISLSGLKKRNCISSNNENDERQYLQSVEENLEKGLSPADILIDKYLNKWNKNLLPIYEENIF